MKIEDDDNFDKFNEIKIVKKIKNETHNNPSYSNTNNLNKILNLDISKKVKIKV